MTTKHITYSHLMVNAISTCLKVSLEVTEETEELSSFVYLNKCWLISATASVFAIGFREPNSDLVTFVTIETKLNFIHTAAKFAAIIFKDNQ